MPRTRRNAKLARWGHETAARQAPLDEIPAAELREIRLPPSATYPNDPRFDPEAAALAVTLQDLRKNLRRARWIPWRRRKRPELQRLIDELVDQRGALRAERSRPVRR